MANKKTVTQLSAHSLTIQTLRENARNFNHVADVLEATERLAKTSGYGPASAMFAWGPKLVKTKRKMSAATKKKIAAAQKLRHASPAKTAA